MPHIDSFCYGAYHRFQKGRSCNFSYDLSELPYDINNRSRSFTYIVKPREVLFHMWFPVFCF